MKRLLTIIMLTAWAAGCAYPTSEVQVTDNRSSIAVQGAPAGAILSVDGLPMGAASQYDGRSRALLVEPGLHKIEIISGGKTLLAEKVFLGGGELKTFSVGAQGSAP